jgi:hypothetical protein
MKDELDLLNLAPESEEKLFEEFSIMELEDRLEFAVRCGDQNTNCSCTPKPTV